MFSSEDNRDVHVVDIKDDMLLWMTKVSLGAVGSSPAAVASFVGTL
jgi:hypothetical protein